MVCDPDDPCIVSKY